VFLNGVALYKVVEFEQGILLLNALDKMDRKHVELVVADARTCGEYLVRYLHARADGAAGKSMVEAHRQALQGAIVVRSWEPEPCSKH
jgi:hypothetical protein